MTDRFEAFVGGITVCYKYIQRIKNAEMTELGLKGAHVMVLFFLSHNPEGLTAAQLCGLCAEDKAAISRTLATLLDKGYIQTSGKKYRNLLTLTLEGQEAAKQLDGIIAQWVNLGGDGLTEEDRAVFYRTLEHIAVNLRGNLPAK